MDQCHFAGKRIQERKKHVQLSTLGRLNVGFGTSFIRSNNVLAVSIIPSAFKESIQLFSNSGRETSRENSRDSPAQLTRPELVRLTTGSSESPGERGCSTAGKHYNAPNIELNNYFVLDHILRIKSVPK